MNINLKSSKLKGKHSKVKGGSTKRKWRLFVLTASALFGVVWGSAFSYSPYWLIGTTLLGAFLGGLSQYNCTIGRIINDMLWSLFATTSASYRWYPPSGLVIVAAVLIGLFASIVASLIILLENFFWLELTKHVKIAQLMLIIGVLVGYVIHLYRRKLLSIADKPWASKSDNFVEAAKQNNIDQMSILLKKGANINAKQMKFDFTALIAAAYYGHKEVVQFLIVKGAKVNKKEKINKSTPLIVAAQQGFVDIANMLIAAGAKINNVYGNGVYKEESNDNSGHYENIQKLLHAAGLGAYENEIFHDRTPLMMAACGGHTEIVELLLKNNVDRNDKNSEGKTAAMFAKEMGFNKIAALLDQT